MKDERAPQVTTLNSQKGILTLSQDNVTDKKEEKGKMKEEKGK